MLTVTSNRDSSIIHPCPLVKLQLAGKIGRAGPSAALLRRHSHRDTLTLFHHVVKWECVGKKATLEDPRGIVSVRVTITLSIIGAREVTTVGFISFCKIRQRPSQERKKAHPPRRVTSQELLHNNITCIKSEHKQGLCTLERRCTVFIHKFLDCDSAWKLASVRYVEMFFGAALPTE